VICLLLYIGFWIQGLYTPHLKETLDFEGVVTRNLGVGVFKTVAVDCIQALALGIKDHENRKTKTVGILVIGKQGVITLGFVFGRGNIDENINVIGFHEGVEAGIRSHKGMKPHTPGAPVSPELHKNILVLLFSLFNGFADIGPGILVFVVRLGLLLLGVNHTYSEKECKGKD